MAEQISFPFRLGPNGRIATVESVSSEADVEAIATLILTRPAERPLVPAFGVTDAAFDGLSTAELSAGLAMFGPAVNVSNISVSYPNDSTQQISLTVD